MLSHLVMSTRMLYNDFNIHEVAPPKGLKNKLSFRGKKPLLVLVKVEPG